MVQKRDYILEIQAKRARGWWYPTSAPWRLGTLQIAFEKTPDLDGELLRYFPIAFIAITEAFFREAAKTLLDAGSPYFENLAESPFTKDLRFDLSVLHAVAGKAVTIGELFSHLVPLKSLEGIGRLMTSATGTPFFDAIAGVHDRWDVEVNKLPATPIIGDLRRVLADVGRAFQYRHIYAHELADHHPITHRDVADILQSGSQFIEASAAFISNLLHPNVPLTQSAMNAEAWKEFQSVDEVLTKEYNALLERLAGPQKDALGQSHEIWLRFRQAAATFDGLRFEGGSMQPLIEASSLRQLTEDRLKEVRRIANTDETGRVIRPT
jgi:uncharacterized protein YecT (DUF1311 family)